MKVVECIDDFRLVCKLSDTISVGLSPAEAGQCDWVRLNGGHFDGIWGSGIVVPSGRDKPTVEPDFSTHVDTQYLLQTHDRAYIEVHTGGWRTVGSGGHGALEKLFVMAAIGL